MANITNYAIVLTLNGEPLSLFEKNKGNTALVFKNQERAFILRGSFHKNMGVPSYHLYELGPNDDWKKETRKELPNAKLWRCVQQDSYRPGDFVVVEYTLGNDLIILNVWNRKYEAKHDQQEISILLEHAGYL